MESQGEIYLIADELRSISDLGLQYAVNDYVRERYSRTLSLSARLVAAIEKTTADEVMEEYEGVHVHCGHLAVVTTQRVASRPLLRRLSDTTMLKTLITGYTCKTCRTYLGSSAYLELPRSALSEIARTETLYECA